MKIVRSALASLKEVENIRIVPTEDDTILVSTLDETPLIHTLEVLLGKFHISGTNEIVFIDKGIAQLSAFNVSIIHDFDLWELWIVEDGTIELPTKDDEMDSKLPNLDQNQNQNKMYQCSETGDVQSLAEWKKDFETDIYAQEQELSFDQWLIGELIEVKGPVQARPKIIATSYQPVQYITGYDDTGSESTPKWHYKQRFSLVIRMECILGAKRGSEYR